jgi:hypothetical protein
MAKSKATKLADGGPRTILIEGHRLDQPTFHATYEAMATRAELIEGVVSMPSPSGPEHGRAHVPVIAWLDYYAEHTVGVEVLVNSTAILGSETELEPDAVLRVLAASGGRSRDEHGYVTGPPELVAEIAKATRFIDLGPKLRAYERAGMLEYIVRAIEPDEIFWFGLARGKLIPRTPGDDGFYCSTVFPGLWLDPIALLEGDRRRLRAVDDLGCATPEHAGFVARLRTKPATPSRGAKKKPKRT